MISNSFIMAHRMVYNVEWILLARTFDTRHRIKLANLLSFADQFRSQLWNCVRNNGRRLGITNPVNVARKIIRSSLRLWTMKWAGGMSSSTHTHRIPITSSPWSFISSHSFFPIFFYFLVSSWYVRSKMRKKTVTNQKEDWHPYPYPSARANTAHAYDVYFITTLTASRSANPPILEWSHRMWSRGGRRKSIKKYSVNANKPSQRKGTTASMESLHCSSG